MRKISLVEKGILETSLAQLCGLIGYSFALISRSDIGIHSLQLCDRLNILWEEKEFVEAKSERLEYFFSLLRVYERWRRFW